MKNDVLVIGESCVDIFCYGSCSRLAPAAPVPVFVPIGETSNPGMAMNVQRNLVSLGVSCSIHTNNNWKSVTKTRYVHRDTNQMFLRVDNNDDKISNCKIKTINFNDYKIVVVSDYNKGFLKKEDIQYICNNHSNVFLDTKKKLGSWCVDSKFIKINKKEYIESKDTLPRDIISKLIVTLGEDGCMYKDKKYSVEKVEIKDVSGAGDTFFAGLVSKYLNTQDIFESIKFANDCATKVVQRKGVSIV